jgi:hypothetical protein
MGPGLRPGRRSPGRIAARPGATHWSGCPPSESHSGCRPSRFTGKLPPLCAAASLTRSELGPAAARRRAPSATGCPPWHWQARSASDSDRDSPGEIHCTAPRIVLPTGPSFRPPSQACFSSATENVENSSPSRRVGPARLRLRVSAFPNLVARPGSAARGPGLRLSAAAAAAQAAHRHWQLQPPSHSLAGPGGRQYGSADWH